MTTTKLLGAGYVVSQPVKPTLRESTQFNEYRFTSKLNLPVFDYITDDELSIYHDMPAGESKVFAIGTCFVATKGQMLPQDLVSVGFAVTGDEREQPRSSLRYASKAIKIEPKRMEYLTQNDFGTYSSATDIGTYLTFDTVPFSIPVEKTTYINNGLRDFKLNATVSLEDYIRNDTSLLDQDCYFIFQYQLWANS